MSVKALHICEIEHTQSGACSRTSSMCRCRPAQTKGAVEKKHAVESVLKYRSQNKQQLGYN